MKLTIPFKMKNISLTQLTANESVQVKEDELIVDIPNAETIDAKYSDSYTEESFWDKTKTQAIEIGEKGIISALTLFYASQSKNLGFRDKAIVYGSLGYLVSFIDAIPDLTPMLGYSDDVALLSAAILTLADAIDDECRVKATQKYDELFKKESES